MKDKLVLWGKNVIIGENYFVDKVSDDGNGLSLELTDIDNGERIRVKYDCMVWSYTYTEEVCWGKELSKYFEIYGEEFITKHTFFEVINSSYSEKVSYETSYYVAKPKELLHLKIIATNCVFDIVSYISGPVIEKI